jgi:hypothetical protein
MAKEKTPTVTGTVMYLGPTLRGARHVVNGTIFKGGVPRHLEKELTADPDYAALFVPVADVGAARKELKNATSVLAHCARRVAEKG